METCIRGFSYMPDQNAEVKLEYIEGEELERTWKTTRRQRLKEREQKIWDEFVQEHDVLNSVCRDDPYQFLEQLPEACLKELMEIELQKMQKEREIEAQEQQQALAQEQKGDGDSPRNAEEPPQQQTVTFADLVDGDDSDVIHIVDDDDNDDDQSGPDDEAVLESPGSPCTVRDKFEDEKELSPLSPPLSPDKSSKSSENVTNMIESSIYCAKVKDLRAKINEEILSIITTLENRDILGIDPDELVKMCRRSAEFCARFSRIYMYQLQRQIHDVKRHTSASLPFARHTQFQSQMVRVVSLHQNLLQAFQLFHKSTEQTGCVRESAALLRCVCAAAREAGAAAAAVPAPPHCHAARNLYDDAISSSCDRLEETITEYETNMSNYMNSTANTNTSRSKKSKSSRGKKSVGTWSKSGSKMKSVAESRLSMYSLDTIRAHPKSSSSKDNQSSTGTSKVRGSEAAADDAAAAKQTPRKSPRSRRPLMRAPPPVRPRGRRGPKDAEPRTMVEAVEAVCTPSHMSREQSPLRVTPSPRRRLRRGRLPSAPPGDVTHDIDARSPRKHAATSPRPRLRAISPRKARRTSPKPAQILRAAISSIRSCEPLETAESSQVQLSPVSVIHCAKRDTPRTDAETNIDNKTDSPRPSPRGKEDGQKTEREKKTASPGGRCEVTRIVRQLCGGDAAGNRNDRVSGVKNAQLLCVNGSSPRQPSTPQLLRILEETIQKKVPKTLFQKSPPAKNTERFRLTFNIPDRTAENLFQYRTKFVQHMLTSPMYANSLVGKPWEMIGSVSEQLIDDLLLQCAEEMQLQEYVQDLYRAETC